MYLYLFRIIVKKKPAVVAEHKLIKSSLSSVLGTPAGFSGSADASLIASGTEVASLEVGTLPEGLAEDVTACSVIETIAGVEEVAVVAGSAEEPGAELEPLVAEEAGAAEDNGASLEAGVEVGTAGTEGNAAVGAGVGVEAPGAAAGGCSVVGAEDSAGAAAAGAGATGSAGA